MSDLGLRGGGSRELLVPFGMMKKFREWWWLYNIVSVLNVTELQNMLRNHYSKIGRKRSSSYPRRQHELKFQMIYGQWPLIGYLYKGHCIGTPTLQPLHNPSTSSIWQGLSLRHNSYRTSILVQFLAEHILFLFLFPDGRPFHTVKPCILLSKRLTLVGDMLPTCSLSDYLKFFCRWSSMSKRKRSPTQSKLWSDFHW